MNKEIMQTLGFIKELNAINESKCPICGRDINLSDFKDKLSITEFHISGMCQKCQDIFFS